MKKLNRQIEIPLDDEEDDLIHAKALVGIKA
jgi:hypothetical protein